MCGWDIPLLKRSVITGLLAALLAISLVVAPFAAAQSGGSRYFPETGFTVRDPFLTYFNTTGGLARYGYPITREFVDPATGLLVQYFQNARMEWHPGNPDPYKVQLGLLGVDLGKSKPPIPVEKIPSPADPNCYYFPETGHTACLEFLKYWRSHGGLDAFGYPITEYMIENGRIVQYFQRARMDWYPEKPKDQRMQLAPLGSIYIDFIQLPPKYREPDASLGLITSIRARASVLAPVIVKNEVQTAYVRVTSQLGTPVADAAVTLIVHHAGGDKAYTLPPTNAQGATFRSFDVGDAQAGAVVSMEFIVKYPALPEVRTRTSYMVWYH
jgi:hypothetical protein